MKKDVYIGVAAQRTGASCKAIRLYESLGLLTIRRQGRYRVYSEQDIAFIRLIREGLGLGIRLADMVALKSGTYDFDWPALLQLLALRQQEAEQQISELRAHTERLSTYRQEITACLEQQLDSAPGDRR